MRIFRRVFVSRAMKVHGVVFALGCVGFTCLDWIQGVDSESTTLGLDWAPILILLWLPIFLVHAGFSWWGGEVVDQLDDDTMRRIQGQWFGSYRE